MIVLPAMSSTLVLVNLVGACIALGVGFAAGVWFIGSSNPASNTEAAPSEKPNRDQNSTRNVERAIMASSRLKDLAKGMASDVGAHASKMKAITDDLQQGDSVATDEAVLKAVSRIVDANDNLQERLEQAEKQIEEQAVEIRSHETKACTDSLTNIANRRAFDDEMQRRLAEWNRKQTPFSLLILDIDHFKNFNDTHGHLAGDEVLRVVSKALGDASREMDIPCRYGGEEFAVVLPTTEIRDARIVAERVRQAVEATNTKFEGKTLQVTTSVGLSQVHEGDEVANIVKRADDALYRSKQAGRNCGHVYDGKKYISITPGIGEPDDGSCVFDAAQGTETLDKLPTRPQLIDELNRRVAESHRFGVPLSVMYVSVDNYDAVATEYGPAVGYVSLEPIAEFIAETLREMDLLTRLDDGKFVVMLPGSTENEASRVKIRIEHSLPEWPVPIQDKQVMLKLRFGISGVQPGDTAEHLMARAEESTGKAQADTTINA